MLFKLSMSGLKSKLKDYIVLLAGLVMSISIFYMFETLAMNRAFIEANSMIGPIQFVFHAGSVLLAIVTFFYILYANSFLLSLRQNEFGMYMMLGAKKHKISLLMFMETIVLGFISMVIGVAVGIGLAEGIGRLLMKELEFSSEGYHAFYIPSLVVTCIFFFALFLISAILNIVKMLRVTILQLIHADVQSDRIQIKGKKRIVQAIFSILLLAIGYAAMINMSRLQQFGVITALITITSGTYLLFMSFFPLIIHKMKQNKKRTEKGINVFTFAQLSFRMNSLTKVLATVAMLVALSAGAISAGMAFNNNVEIFVNGTQVYDVTIHNPTAEEKSILDSITFTEKREYRYKTDEKFVYYLRDDLMKNPPQVQVGKDRDNFGETGHVSVDLPVGAESSRGRDDTKDYIKMPTEWAIAMDTIEPHYVHPKLRIKIVDQEMYDQLQEGEGIAWIGKSDDFVKYKEAWKQMDALQLKKYPDLKSERMNSKLITYEGLRSFSSGTVYMGFFLGIAFLAMMASCLMFKILTGASKDIKRYEMLRKIGVRRELLTKSIYKELFVVFLFPAILGIVHMLIGMEMFSFIIVHPYYRVWLPIVMFVVIYAAYYFVTVRLYRGIVLRKEK